MKKLCFILAAFILLTSHDMFLKLDTFFLQPQTPSTIKLYNGTFAKSENVIGRERMLDVSLVGHGSRTQVDTTQWTEKDSMTLLHFTTGKAGTWVAGVSTRPRNIELAAADFNDYLAHDGILDLLDWRKKNQALDQDAIEKYSKHVKAVFQVGDQKTNDWQTILGYPIEFVPLNNPYDLQIGEVLRVQLLWQGQPLSNQLVYAGTDGGNAHHHNHEHEQGGAEEGHHHHGVNQLRTDANGQVSLPLSDQGRWFLRTIHLVPSEEEGLTHESNWATLTFEVKAGHHHEDAAHGHHHHGDGHTHSHDTSYLYWLGGIALLLGVLWMLKRRK